MSKPPTIPEPTTDPRSLQTSLLTLKEGYELLTGQRHDIEQRAVTWADLLRLGLVSEGDVPRK